MFRKTLYPFSPPISEFDRKNRIDVNALQPAILLARSTFIWSRDRELDDRDRRKKQCWEIQGGRVMNISKMILRQAIATCIVGGVVMLMSAAALGRL